MKSCQNTINAWDWVREIKNPLRLQWDSKERFLKLLSGPWVENTGKGPVSWRKILPLVSVLAFLLRAFWITMALAWTNESQFMFPLIWNLKCLFWCLLWCCFKHSKSYFILSVQVSCNKTSNDNFLLVFMISKNPFFLNIVWR